MIDKNEAPVGYIAVKDTYNVISQTSCEHCDLFHKPDICNHTSCESVKRKDGESVIFKQEISMAEAYTRFGIARGFVGKLREELEHMELTLQIAQDNVTQCLEAAKKEVKDFEEALASVPTDKP